MQDISQEGPNYARIMLKIMLEVIMPDQVVIMEELC